MLVKRVVGQVRELESTNLHDDTPVVLFGEIEFDQCIARSMPNQDEPPSLVMEIGGQTRHSGAGGGRASDRGGTTARSRSGPLRRSSSI